MPLLCQSQRIVAHPNSKVRSVKIPGRTKTRFRTKFNQAIKIPSSKFKRTSQRNVQRNTSPGVVTIAVIAACKFNLKRLHSVSLTATFDVRCYRATYLDFFKNMNKTFSEFFHLVFSDWSFKGTCLFTNTTSIIF